MICTQSLYSSWKEEKSLIKSLEELNNVRLQHHIPNLDFDFLTQQNSIILRKVNNSYLTHGLSGDYSKQLELGYQNAGYSGSQHHLNAPILAITKYSTSSDKSLKRLLMVL